MMERQQKATALLLSLLGLFLVAHARSRYEAEDVDIFLNVDKQPMEDLLQHMRAILSDNEPQLYIGGHRRMRHREACPAGGSMSTSPPAVTGRHLLSPTQTSTWCPSRTGRITGTASLAMALFSLTVQFFHFQRITHPF
jgi:hypothetical protein